MGQSQRLQPYMYQQRSGAETPRRIRGVVRSVAWGRLSTKLKLYNPRGFRTRARPRANIKNRVIGE
eukprot:SAG22_NODE_13664_length_398_cov_2.545151_1_plen_65_part_01